MAKVDYSAEINELTGSVGGTCFQRNASGTISRLKNIRRGRSTAKRQASNILLNSIVAVWTRLPLTQQQAWNDWAALHTKFNYHGAEKTLTGFNWFVSINCNRSITGQELLTAPPTYATPGVVPEFSLDIDDGGIEVEWSSFPAEADYYLFIFSTPPIFSQSIKNRNKIKLLGSFNPNGAHYIDLTSSWEAAFNITWPSTSVSNSFYILISMAAVDKVTGISGQFTSVIKPIVF